MPAIDDDTLPDAYRRLLAAQRVVSPEELAEIERRSRVDSEAAKYRRSLPKVY